MNTNDKEQGQRKAAVSVKDMAAMCGLSRQRFAQLVKAGVFPAPLYDPASRRPFYGEEAQAICVSVRQKNVGVNGKIVMFYCRRPRSEPTRPSKPAAKAEVNRDVIEGLKGLGLSAVTSAEVARAVTELFPAGTANVDVGEVIRAVFMRLRRRDSAVSVRSKEAVTDQ